MHFKLAPILIAAALCVGASSCGNRVETQVTLPRVADLRVDPEPTYPEAALEPGPTGQLAEEQWWTDVLGWGRTHHDRLARVCKWAVDLGLEVPEGYCGP